MEKTGVLTFSSRRLRLRLQGVLQEKLEAAVLARLLAEERLEELRRFPGRTWAEAGHKGCEFKLL